MVSKISDFLTSNPNRITDIGGLLVIDRIGEYIRQEIVDVCTPLSAPIPPVYYQPNETSYTGKIDLDLRAYAATLEAREISTTSDDGKVTIMYIRNDGSDIITSLNNPSSLLKILVSNLEVRFTIDQLAAATQFNVPAVPPSPLPIGSTPPYLYVPGNYYSIISSIIPTDIELKTAFETFIALQYSLNGLG